MTRADAVPKLCTIILGRGRLTQRGIAALAEAERKGKWPDLTKFVFERFEVPEDADWDMIDTFSDIKKAWPRLEMGVGKGCVAAAAASWYS